MRPIPLLLILSALALPALSQAAVRVEVLQNRLAQPWGMAFLPDDQGILITLRGGELKRWQPGKALRRQSFWRQAGVRRQRIFVYRAGRK